MNGTMDTEKRRRLENLDGEVKSFHPLLRALLPKMPRVKTVEYTHGNTEMGADFVLSRLDDTFDTLDHVGVVAKLGKMDQESVSDIERQIDECFIKKLFDSGKQEIYINEVWVITTGSVTKNAQYKIQDKFRSKKIVFTPRDKLIGLIDRYAPNFWTDVTLEVGEYLYALRQRNDEAEIRLSLLKDHRDIYIEQDLYRIPANEYEAKKQRSKKEERIDATKALDLGPILLVEGEMGAGKSKMLRQLLKHYTTPQIYLDTKFIPIAISYKKLVDSYNCDFDAAIKDNISPDIIKELSPWPAPR